MARKTTNCIAKTNASLLIINYAMNKNSQVFSHQYRVAIELHKSFNETIVLTSELGEDLQSEGLPFPVRSTRWQSGKTFSNLAKLLYEVLKIEWKFKPKIVFYHMTNSHAAFLAPLFRLLGKRQVLWYAHTAYPTSLAIAKKFMNAVVTSTRGSSPLPDSIPLGQAIDLDIFKFQRHSLESKLMRVIHVGRIDPSKKIDELIQWFIENRDENNLGLLNIVGESTYGKEDYFRYLTQKYDFARKQKLLCFSGRINHEELGSTLEEHDLFLHLFEGSLDKAVLEAVACGIPVISINKEFLRVFGTWSRGSDSKWDKTFEQDRWELFLLYELKAFRLYSKRQLATELKRRRRIVETQHSLDLWIKNLVEILKVKDADE